MMLQQPSDEEKREATRLLSRALAAAGGAAPPYCGKSDNEEEEEVEDKGRRSASDDAEDAADGGGSSVNGWYPDDGRAGVGRLEIQGVLAEVHLAMSEFSLKGRGGAAVCRASDGGVAGAKEWHLRQAARAARDTKAGIIARFV